MTDLPDQLCELAGCLNQADSDLLRRAAAEIRRLVLLTGQPDIDRCERSDRLEAELADCRLLHTELSRRLLKSMEPAVRPEWIDGLGVIEDEVE